MKTKPFYSAHSITSKFIRRCCITFASFILLICCSSLFASDDSDGLKQNSGLLYNVTVTPRKQDANGKARYRLWIPEGVKTVRAIIVRQHGCGKGARKFGLNHANDLQWQALARKWDCALLGSQLWAPKEVCSTWYIPQDGSERAFLTAIKQLAKTSQHAELQDVPWAIWGHSGGAVWTMNMVYRHPEKIIAAFPRSGGLIPASGKFPRSQPPQPDSNPAAYRVPVMFCYGEKENQPGKRFYGAVTSTHSVFDPARKKKALWSVAEHPGVSHDNGNSRLLAIRFFDAMLAKRLPSSSQKEKSSLQSLDFNKGWLGDSKTKKIYPVAKFQGDQSGLSWLPNKTTALAWQELVTKGTLSDSTPPAAPRKVTQTKQSHGIKLHWQAEADIESGIHEFRIYRNKKLIGTVKGHEHRRWNPQSHFHSWNYSDQPIFDKLPLPVMQYIDTSKEQSMKAKYSVTTVNQAGLESKKKEAVSK
ncbi:hypothetical protein MNBD_PLANCTO02-1209 [hydrothermal vent metagenome]|uniref:Uncharacterized protein n=1 Tax=hydrothermal vent metagenome TaxID=652676 RepID=A0A3B1DTU5_9ZZZZ